MDVSVAFDFARVREPAFHYEYLHYFTLALRAHLGARVSIRPLSGRALVPLIDLGLPGARRVWNVVSDRQHSGRFDGTEYVRLTFTMGCGRQVKVVIDFWDARELTHPDALRWCDVYFKTNYWPTLKYPRKVRPLMNANGLRSAEDLRGLRAMRDAPRTKDLVHWAMIWEARGAGAYSTEETYNIVEHQIRLFEALSRLPGDTDLIAIVPRNLAVMPYDVVATRLELSGVRVQPDWGEINTARLWERLRSARVVFLRTGNHHCISWRLTELLAMGACIVYDGAPYPNWPVPLVAGTHYLDGHCQLSPNFSSPSLGRYTCLTDRIRSLLADEPAMSGFRHETADYFDTHCTQRAIGKYILRCVEAEAAGR